MTRKVKQCFENPFRNWDNYVLIDVSLCITSKHNREYETNEMERNIIKFAIKTFVILCICIYVCILFFSNQKVISFLLQSPHDIVSFA